ncbi:unnamed protein product [Adineta steineri]|uniref:Uncharacterized protein n=1 Tax=Adineta steineri TaxID=433720 RepID=A0A815MJ98_9BILA|nr:unnamed protein product [Adineta steineri]CAF3933941.1 unnamed protein product [Adineta steineri]
MQSIFILLVTLGWISMVSTYQCYDCVSSFNIYCGDPFNGNGMTHNDKKEAPADGTCMVKKVTTSFGSVVTRSTNSIAKFCIGGLNGCGEKSLLGINTTICCCTSNFCNGVSTVQQKPLLIFLLMSTLAMLTYR